jgi:hypothetical protein
VANMSSPDEEDIETRVRWMLNDACEASSSDDSYNLSHNDNEVNSPTILLSFQNILLLLIINCSVARISVLVTHTIP